jgi:hypothetical protein
MKMSSRYAWVDGSKFACWGGGGGGGRSVSH